MAPIVPARSIIGVTVRRLCRLTVVVLVTAGLIALAPAGHACACGAAVAPQGGNATMNREVALAHWDGATETILLQLGMKASTDNVALVVPTPTPAAVAASDKALFTELDRLTAPEIRHQRHWKFGLILGSSAHSDRASAAATRGPTVLSQVHLGPLEATTLAGGDLPGLQKWLADNGYSIKPTVSQALEPYVRDGWAFVALRLTSTSPIDGGLDPVRLTFQSSRLVYPMRLSVAATSPQHVTVFTMTDHRQQRTDADTSAQTTTVQFAGNVAEAVHDPILRELAGNHGSYLTKTQVDISQTSGITSDFTFGDAPDDSPYRQVIVVQDDVAVPVELMVLGVFVLTVVGALVLWVVLRRHRRSRTFG